MFVPHLLKSLAAHPSLVCHTSLTLIRSRRVLRVRRRILFINLSPLCDPLHPCPPVLPSGFGTRRQRVKVNWTKARMSVSVQGITPRASETEAAWTTSGKSSGARSASLFQWQGRFQQRQRLLLGMRGPSSLDSWRPQGCGFIDCRAGPEFPTPESVRPWPPRHQNRWKYWETGGR